MNLSINTKISLLIVVVAGLIAFSLSVIYPFWNLFVGIWTILEVVLLVFNMRKNSDKERELVEQDLRDQIFELEGLVAEKDEVVDHYEKLLDTQVVKMPCNCGGILFQGILTPEHEIVQCESCEEKYRIIVEYGTVLLTDTLENEKVLNDTIGHFNKLL